MPDSLSRGYTKIRDIGSGGQKGSFYRVARQLWQGCPGSGQGGQALRHEDHRHEPDGHEAEKGAAQELMCFAAVQDAINEVRVLSSLKHPYIVQGLSCLESL